MVIYRTRPSSYLFRTGFHTQCGTVTGALAQLGEHLLCKQGVIGSIPIRSTKLIREADRRVRQVIPRSGMTESTGPGAAPHTHQDLIVEPYGSAIQSWMTSYRKEKHISYHADPGSAPGICRFDLRSM